MKISISVPEEDLAILDRYAAQAGLASRSAAVHHAIRLLRVPDLEDDYAAAWSQWESSGEHALWDAAVGDGLADAPR